MYTSVYIKTEGKITACSAFEKWLSGCQKRPMIAQDDRDKALSHISAVGQPVSWLQICDMKYADMGTKQNRSILTSILNTNNVIACLEMALWIYELLWSLLLWQGVLRDVFAEYGDIASVYIKEGTKQGQGAYFAWVTLETILPVQCSQNVICTL